MMPIKQTSNIEYISQSLCQMYGSAKNYYLHAKLLKVSDVDLLELAKYIFIKFTIITFHLFLTVVPIMNLQVKSITIKHKTNLKTKLISSKTLRSLPRSSQYQSSMLYSRHKLHEPPYFREKKTYLCFKKCNKTIFWKTTYNSTISHTLLSGLNVSLSKLGYFVKQKSKYTFAFGIKITIAYIL